MHLSGKYFGRNSSRSFKARISIIDRKAKVYIEDSLAENNLAIQSIQNRQDVYFEDGSLFISSKQLSDEQLGQLTDRSQKILAWLELFTPKRAIVFAIILMTMVVGYSFAFSSLVATFTSVFPEEWEQRIGQTVYQNMLSSGIFSQSQLSEERIAGLIIQAQKLMDLGEETSDIQIKFHQSDFYGANAFALPGGPIVVTDELVNILENDSYILAVIAHEIAHVRKRHSLQQIAEVAGVSLIAIVLFGADESILEEVSAIALGLWASNRSRKHEREADLVAIMLIEETGITPTDYKDALEKITLYHCEEEMSADVKKCLGNKRSGWLSTHPTYDERLEYLGLR